MTIQTHDNDFAQERIAALRATGLLSGSAPEEFHEACEQARLRFEVPIVQVTLVTDRRVLPRAALGMRADAAPRLRSFCDEAIRRDEVLVVPDAREDPRFAAHPLVVGAPFLRFYAGAPLPYVRGVRLGTLCLLDTRPRTLSPADQAELEAMAEGLMAAVLERQFDRLAARTIC